MCSDNTADDYFYDNKLTQMMLDLAGNGELEDLKNLILDNGGINLWGNSDLCALAFTYAAEGGYLETMEYLFSIGTDITAYIVSCYDNMAVKNAAFWGHLEVVKYLISLGADYGIREISELLDIKVPLGSKEEAIEALNIAMVNNE